MDLKLKELVSIRTGIVLQRKKASVVDANTSEYHTITLKSFNGTLDLVTGSTDTFVSTEEIKADYLSSEGDILLRLREPNYALHINKSNEGLLISSLIAVIRVNNNLVDSKFLAYYLNSEKVKKQLTSGAIKGTAINMIKTKDVSDITIKLPSLEEQKKIVSYLDLNQQELNLLEELQNQKSKLSKTLFEKLI